MLQTPPRQDADASAEGDAYYAVELVECVTKVDGGYVLGPVALGEYELVVHHFGRAMPVSVRTTLREGVNRVDVALPVTSLEGRLVDRDKQPWGSAWIQLHDPLATSWNYDRVPSMHESPTGEIEYDRRESTSYDAHTDAEGRFHFRGVSAGRALMLYAGADYMEPLMIEIPSLADGDHRDLGTLVRDVFGELVVTLETRPTAPFELKLFDAKLDVELVEHGVPVGIDDDLPAWSLARGHYRVELHDATRPGEPRSGEAIVEPRLQTLVHLP